MTGVLYGVFTVADVQVALPLSELREVIPCPASFEPLLATGAGLVGAVNLRHQVIPVLDLRRLLGLQAPPGQDVVVVAAHDGVIFGLLAGAVRGVVHVDADADLGMTVNGELPPLFGRTFERPDDGAVVCVLDCAAIRRLPGIALATDTGGPSGAMAQAQAQGAASAGAGGTRGRGMMLLRAGEIGLCVDVSHIHSVVPELMLKSSPIDNGVIHGVVELGERYVPTVDTLAVLGLGALAPIDAKRGVALAFPRGLLTFAVTEVVSIVSAPPDDVLPTPAFGLPASAFAVGILPGQAGGSYLVLDGAALRADGELEVLAALGTPIGGAAPARREAPEGPPAQDGRVIEHRVRKYLTYLAGAEVATPLAQIEEIVPHPTDIIPFAGGGPTRGVFTHRSTSVPLVDLPALLGGPAAGDPAAARVLLVAGVGFIVPALRAIEESTWEERVPGDVPAPTSLAGSPLVKIGTRMLARLDLAGFARTMVGDREHGTDPGRD
ncbi:chemotaxis protein CheW [Dactylosporangium sp. NPDC000555]|uniref:chemotaxis protein CheW n=1 Tax=Dactylosporangium sp. NPDC000555 TaxID=3154260 RepID=UPI00332503CA